MTSDGELLGRYAAARCEESFAELVRRHLDLVYSAALRQVNGDAHLAQDVAQTVFSDLARKAADLAHRPVLTGWLYTSTHYAAAKAVRTERRRLTREEEAHLMHELLHHSAPDPDWDRLRPVLDAAMLELDEPDREAVLLRYFEDRRHAEIAERLGLSENAARMRVERALDKLRDLLTRRGVSTTAVLSTVITTNAVQAAPAGLAITITAASTLAGATVVATATATTLQTIAMTTLQKILVTTALAAAIGVALYENRQVAGLREQNQRLQKQLAPLAGQLEQLQRERDRATNRVASVAQELATVKQQPTEVFKLRGQVGVLRQEKDAIGSKSALSKITADPETRKLMREQQKMGMSFIYAELAKRLQLKPEQTGQFNDLLADHVMESIDLITQSLHDNRSSAEIDRLFTAQEAAMQGQLATLLGQEGLTQYQDYSKQIVSTLTGIQFEGSLAGDKEAKTEKRKQLSQVMQEELQAALVAAGLPADYQTMPMLNFRNIASEETGEKSLKLLENTYDRVAARANVFLSAEELVKFGEFGKKVLENNRTALLMNRKLMAPIAK